MLPRLSANHPFEWQRFKILPHSAQTALPSETQKTKGGLKKLRLHFINLLF